MEYVVPGDYLGEIAEYKAGEGVYTCADVILAKFAGMPKIYTSNNNEKPTIKVISHCTDSSNYRNIPSVGSICVCKVVKLTRFMCYVKILTTNGQPLYHPFNGVIKKESIWSHQVEGYTVQKAFQVKDIVVARIVSVSDSHRSDSSTKHMIFLSTAEKELGVIYALSCDSPQQVLLPYSWKEMANHTSGLIENRKVAKIRLYENQF